MMMSASLPLCCWCLRRKVRAFGAHLCSSCRESLVLPLARVTPDPAKQHPAPGGVVQNRKGKSSKAKRG
jgi:hypothetical protein